MEEASNESNDKYTVFVTSLRLIGVMIFVAFYIEL